MAESGRAARLADQIKRIVAHMLDTRIKDPRLGFVTVTDVRVTGDSQHATVLYTVLGDAEQHASTAAALASATGLIRSEVGAQLGTRLTPTLTFQLDHQPEGVARVEDALAEAARRDAEVARLREGKSHAGDADPYRAPASDEADEADESDRSTDE